MNNHKTNANLAQQGDCVAGTKAAAQDGFLSTLTGKLIAAAAAVALLAGGALLISRGNWDSPPAPVETAATTQPKETTAPSAETTLPATEATELTTTPAETTLPPEETPEAHLDTILLDLAGQNLAQISQVLGSCTYGDGYYWFDEGNIGCVFAYGEQSGCNYILAPLDRLIIDCPPVLTAEVLQQYLPGGYTFYDDMSGITCFGWEYRGCTIVIGEKYDGTYEPASIFYYNCDDLVEQTPQTSAAIQDKLFQFPGKTKQQIDAIWGAEGQYSGEYGCLIYPNAQGLLLVYMEDYTDSNSTCIAFHAPLSLVVDAPLGYVETADLLTLFGDTYGDPWNGTTSYTTMYNGGLLQIISTIPDQPGCFITQSSAVNFRLADKEIFPGSDPTVMTNSSDMLYARVTVYSHNTTELVCSISYQQLTSPYRVNQLDQVTLTSTDGITYTASGVVDSWSSTLTVTATALDQAMAFSFQITQVGDYANFAFGDFIVYQ